MTRARRRWTLTVATTSLVPLLVASCAGGSVGGQSHTSVPAAPVNTEATVSAAPAEIDCHGWQRANFFALASVELVRECLQAGADPNDPRDYIHAIYRASRDATDPAVIRLLTEAGADPNSQEDGNFRVQGYRRGYSALHAAAQWNPNAAIINALVAAGADLEARDAEGATPLHAAWGNPNPAVVRALLESGADPLARDRAGRVADPTSCANWNTAAFTRHAYTEDFALCLALGEDVLSYDGNGSTPLHFAAQFDNPDAVTTLLAAGADVTAQDNRGATPLHLAAIHDGTASLNLLLEAGADINAGAGSQGTPLLHALTKRRGLRGGSSETAVDALLKAGADINAADSTGNTPLLASMGLPRRLGWPTTDLPLRLLALGADPNSRDEQGRTPLHAAASDEGPTVIRALFDAGADPQALTDVGASPLHPAAESGNPEVITLLASSGVDPNRLDDDSRAPLHLAVWERRNRFVAAWFPDAPWRLRAFALLEAGADPDVRTPEGDTPLHLLMSGYQPDTAMVSGLVEVGANVNARNDRGETPLHIARAHNRLVAALKLLELGADPGAVDNAGRIADPVCSWEPGNDRFTSWDFLAQSPAESVRGCLEGGVSLDARDEEGRTPLAGMVSTRGCCADGENVIPLLVASGADVNARDHAGRTPLHRAFGWPARTPGSVLPSVTSALLDAGADPNARDSLGWTPLHIAPSSVVPLLASAGADLDSRNNAGETPLHVALRRGDQPKVVALLRQGADPTAQDNEGNTADPVSCERWGSGPFLALADPDAVVACFPSGADAPVADRATRLLFAVAGPARDPTAIDLLLQAGAGADARDGSRYTPLHNAARSGVPGVVRALLAAGADVNAWATGFATDYGWSWTPLQLAAASNPDPEVVAALLEAGADLAGDGNYPLHLAAANPNPAIVQTLLDAGADVTALSGIGRTPLHEAAAANSNPAVIKLLVGAGADVHALDSNGFMPLHAAAWYNPNPGIATALIAAGADVNARDPEGHLPSGHVANDRTPLFMATDRGGGFGIYVSGDPGPALQNAAVIDVLVRAGADLEQSDSSGRTPLHAAAQTHPAVFPLLLRLGADPNARDANGKTPLNYALVNRSLEGLPEVRRLREAMRRRATGR